MRTRTLAFFLALLFIAPALSHAWWGQHKPPRIGSDVSDLPAGYAVVRVGGEIYYYKNGVYYSQVGGHYMVIRAPVGAVVGNLPGYYRKTVINGVTYYTSGRTYYMRTPEGYRVVATPLGVVK